MKTTSSCTAFYLQQAHLMETSRGKRPILFLCRFFEYLHENVSSIGWKPSWCFIYFLCLGRTTFYCECHTECTLLESILNDPVLQYSLSGSALLNGSFTTTTMHRNTQMGTQTWNTNKLKHSRSLPPSLCLEPLRSPHFN